MVNCSDLILLIAFVSSVCVYSIFLNVLSIDFNYCIFFRDELVLRKNYD